MIWHDSHNGNVIAIIKNGSQQITKAPVIIANVFAAFLSRFASSVSLRFVTCDWAFDILADGVGVDGIVWCWCCTGVDAWLDIWFWFWFWFCTDGVVNWFNSIIWLLDDADWLFWADVAVDVWFSTWLETVAIWFDVVGSWNNFF